MRAGVEAAAAIAAAANDAGTGADKPPGGMAKHGERWGWAARGLGKVKIVGGGGGVRGPVSFAAATAAVAGFRLPPPSVLPPPLLVEVVVVAPPLQQR